MYHKIGMSGAARRALAKYGWDAVPDTFYELYNTDEPDLHVSQISLVLPFCFEERPTRVLLLRGVHLAITRRMWNMARNPADPAPAWVILDTMGYVIRW